MTVGAGQPGYRLGLPAWAFAGWRGRRAMYLYLWGFVVLGLAYFGSRYILEYILGRSWS